MLLQDDPDGREVTVTRHVCAYHRKHPLGQFAGCTCSSTIGFRVVLPEEKALNRRRRLTARREELRAELDEIERELTGA